MKTLLFTTLVLVLLTVAAFGWEPPQPGLSYTNPFSDYNPDNPFGIYGNPFSEYSPKNHFGVYGSPFTDRSPLNHFSQGPEPSGGPEGRGVPDWDYTPRPMPPLPQPWDYR
jgi:hypothetical protein